MKIVCIGRNYAEHAKELNNPVPTEPLFFIKPDSAVLRNNDDFYLPDFSEDVHYEAEIYVKLHKKGKNIQEKFAASYYAELGIGIDITARDIQQKCKEKGLPWEKAKAFDGSAVIGKFCNKSVLNLENIRFQLERNEEIVQDGESSHMLWKIDELIAYVSQYFTLKIGDVLFTGTPAGVGRVETNDQLKGTLEGKEMFQIKVK